jgi:1,4-dihydroxy-2-naphthoyl-CoA hydrolase
MHRFEPETLHLRTRGCFVRERDVRFQDVDAAGVVFFPRVLEYLNDAFLALIESAGIDLPAVLRDRRWGAPLRHAEADFLKPLRYGDRVEVAIVRAHREGSALTLGYRIARLGDGALVALGQTAHVFVDLRSFERCPVPTELDAVLARLLA